MTYAYHISYVLRPNIAIPVGVSEINLNSNMSIYPNPSNGRVYIHNGNANAADFTINVFNSIGEVVYTGAYNNRVNAVVDLSDKSNGVYTIQMKSTEEVITQSVVISNK